MEKKQTDNYNKLVLRNGFFIPDKLQDKIADCKLVFIGCGLASSVAIAAARMGFQHFCLVDGDTVELSNLNRQDFYLQDIGRNKASVISERIRSINLECEIEVIDRRVGVEDIEALVKGGDIIINSADFDEVTYVIDELSAEYSKLSISPLNIGFGSVVTIFNKDSKRLSALTGGVCKNDTDYLLTLYKNLEDFRLPKYIKKNIPKALLFIATKGFFPQNVIAAQTSTLLITDVLLKYLRGDKIVLAPKAVNLDVEELVV